MFFSAEAECVKRSESRLVSLSFWGFGECMVVTMSMFVVLFSPKKRMTVMVMMKINPLVVPVLKCPSGAAGAGGGEEAAVAQTSLDQSFAVHDSCFISLWTESDGCLSRQTSLVFLVSPFPKMSRLLLAAQICPSLSWRHLLAAAVNLEVKNRAREAVKRINLFVSSVC